MTLGVTSARIAGGRAWAPFPGYSPGERLVIWRGLGTGSTFKARSTQNMR
jgi:hypothetical protein